MIEQKQKVSPTESVSEFSKESSREFFWPIRVYYEDTDSGGVVYYANYLKFMERARTEMLRSLGFEQDQLQQQLGILFAVHSVNIQYKKPAKFNDGLNVVTTISTCGKASIVFIQKIFHDDVIDDSQANASAEVLPLCSAEVKIACLNAEKFIAQAMPVSIVKKIQSEYVCGS